MNRHRVVQAHAYAATIEALDKLRSLPAGERGAEVFWAVYQIVFFGMENCVAAVTEPLEKHKSEGPL